jgi:hypothetical protein
MVEGSPKDDLRESDRDYPQYTELHGRKPALPSTKKGRKSGLFLEELLLLVNL